MEFLPYFILFPIKSQIEEREMEYMPYALEFGPYNANKKKTVNEKKW